MTAIKKGDKNIFEYDVLSTLVLLLVFFGFGFTTGYAQTKPVIKTFKSFHNIHVQEEELECIDCHTKTGLKGVQKPMKMKRKKSEKFKNANYIIEKSGVLMVSPTSSLSRVDREVCLDCHDSGDKPWYGDKKMKAGDAYKKNGR